MSHFKTVIEAIEDWTSGILISAGLLVLFYGVILRYVFELPTTWQDEVAKYFVIWGVFIGACVALRDNHHVRVDILYQFLPEKAQRWVNIFANFVTLIFFVFLMVYGYELVEKRFLDGQKSFGEFYLWKVYLILPIAGVLLSLRTIERLIRLFKGKPESDYQGEELSVS